MIRSFGVQNSDYIDITQAGDDGSPVNGCWIPNVRPDEVFASAQNLAPRVERKV
jgi:hypothetical protein